MKADEPKTYTTIPTDNDPFGFGQLIEQLRKDSPGMPIEPLGLTVFAASTGEDNSGQDGMRLDCFDVDVEEQAPALGVDG